MKRFTDQFVGDVRPVELCGVDVVDAQLNCAPQHGQSLVVVARRPEHTGTGKLHGAESDAADMELSPSGKVCMTDWFITPAAAYSTEQTNRAEIAGYSDSPRIW